MLQVEHFEAPDVLRDNRIISYSSPTELKFDQYHRWSSDPGELLSELVMKYFSERGLFEHVYAFPAPVAADYTLRGRVLDFGEIKYEKNGSGNLREARLGLRLDLLETQQNKVVWSNRLEQTEPVKKHNTRGVVDALNIAAESLLQKAFASVTPVVEREYAQKQEHAH